MRVLVMVPILALAACSDSGQTNKAAPAAAVASSIDAGQWETVAEVTNFRMMDKGAPMIKAAKGDKVTGSTCVPEGDRARPAPALFTTNKDDCTYRDFYMSSGTLNASLACKRPGLRGQVMVSVQGSYTATTLDATARTETYLVTDGDVNIDTKVTSRRTGACA